MLGENRYVIISSRKELLSLTMMCHNTEGSFGVAIGLESDISDTLCVLQIRVLLGELRKSSNDQIFWHHRLNIYMITFLYDTNP